MPAYNYYGGSYGNPYVPGGYYQSAYQTQPMMPQQQQMQVPQVQVPQSTQNPSMTQIQNGGFITVRSEAEARAYPVAPGTSVTFKHETAPYCYTKTMGFNQFEAPRFEKFKLVREDDEQQADSEDGKENPLPNYAKEEDLGKLAGIVKSINEAVNVMKADVDGLKSDMYGVAGKRKASKKAEAVEDDA